MHIHVAVGINIHVNNSDYNKQRGNTLCLKNKENCCKKCMQPLINNKMTVYIKYNN